VVVRRAPCIGGTACRKRASLAGARRRYGTHFSVATWEADVAEALSLGGAELDAAVARAEIAAGQLDVQMTHGGPLIQDDDGEWEAFRPSVNWAHAGPIIERAGIALLSTDPGHCTAAVGAEWADGRLVLTSSPIQLIAVAVAALVLEPRTGLT